MKNTFEQFNPNAERRREKAEEKGILNISHWRGNLHGHTKTDISDPKLPEDIVEDRKGSNCGDVPLDVLLKYHGQEMKNEFVAITEHSRDGNTEKAIEGMTNWFLGMYLSNNSWLQENYLKAKEDLSEEELNEIREMAKEQAEKVALYGDERVEEILEDIENNQEEGIEVFKGIEVSLLPDGSFDSELPSSEKLDMVVCSVHPDVDKEDFANIINDSEKYTDLIIKGIKREETNIIGHIGYGLEDSIVEKLGWERIAKSILENKTALEINLKDLHDYIYKELLDYDKYPKGDNSYRKEFEAKLNELVPLISSEIIREKLRPYIEQGLKLSINIDEHKNKYIKHETDKEGTKHEFLPRDLRYWRAMKMLERYFNDIFTELGVKKENIINTYSVEELKKVFNKTK